MLKAREFGYPAGHDILFEHVVKILLVADLAAPQGVGADVEIHVLGLQASDRYLELLVAVLGAFEQAQAVAVQNHFDIHVLGADGVDVVLNVPQGPAVHFVLVTARVVDVIDHLLLAVAFTRHRSVHKKGHGRQGRDQNAEKAHVFLP